MSGPDDVKKDASDDLLPADWAAYGGAAVSRAHWASLHPFIVFLIFVFSAPPFGIVVASGIAAIFAPNLGGNSFFVVGLIEGYFGGIIPAVVVGFVVSIMYSEGRKAPSYLTTAVIGVFVGFLYGVLIAAFVKDVGISDVRALMLKIALCTEIAIICGGATLGSLATTKLLLRR
jgi:hypothetical protein